jgi:pimeloyl-ACP methyl ester carboxylesterase
MVRTMSQSALPEYARLHIAPLPRSRSALAYFELGDPNGTPLLCLHGLSVSGYFFSQFHEFFARRGIRAIAPCLLGGIYASDREETVESLVGKLVELLDGLDIERFDVMGFSWGTLVQLGLIARVPQRIRKAGLLGPMLPMRFLGKQDLDGMKSDVRLTLRMVGRVPILHRCLMWLVCRLPVTVLLDQFKDPSLSVAELEALAPGHAFRSHFERCLKECTRTGSAFLTDGWRMFLDEPGYTLGDLASIASSCEIRLYVGERDNVHLPAFANLIAATINGTPIGLPSPSAPAAHGDIFRQVDSGTRCSIRMAPGAGRMACVLYFKQAMDDLMSAAEPSPCLAQRARA